MTTPKRPYSSPGGRHRIREAQIRRLQIENSRLQVELSLKTERTCDQSSLETVPDIARLQEDYAQAKVRLGRDRIAIAELQARIDTLRKELVEMRRQNSAAVPKLVRQIHVAENRLDKALVRYNEAIAFITDLHESIEALRREWMVYNGTYARLDAELKQKQMEIGQVTEQTVQVYKMREAAQVKLADLKLETDREKDKLLKLSKQLHERLPEYRLLAESAKPLLPGATTMTDAKGSSQDEMDLKKRVERLGQALEEKTTMVESGTKQANELQQSLQQILSGTGATSVNELVSSMQESETVNRDLYEKVTELTSQTIINLEEDLNRMERETAKAAEKKGSGSDLKRVQMIDEFQRELDMILCSTEREEAKLRDAKKAMTDLRPILNEILERLKIDYQPPITEGHFSEIMGLIERETQQLIQNVTNHEETGVYKEDDSASISVVMLPTIDTSEEEKDGGESSDGNDMSCAPVAVADIRLAREKGWQKGVVREASLPNLEKIFGHKFIRAKSTISQ